MRYVDDVFSPSKDEIEDPFKEGKESQASKGPWRSSSELVVKFRLWALAALVTRMGSDGST